eukprot:evm.model.scf_551.4 EVM.evm.TU.scf_551.4   scf_551:43119-45776(+)
MPPVAPSRLAPLPYAHPRVLHPHPPIPRSIKSRRTADGQPTIAPHRSATGCRSVRPRMDAPVVASASAPVEKSYIMIKPDGVQRGLVGEVIGRFERKGFKLVGLKMFRCPRQLAEEHYGELKDRPFFPKLVDYITSGPVVCMVWEGDGVVASARKLIGKTDPLEADPGTIRGDLGLHKGRNVVHGSDSPENGLRETALWFSSDELQDWEQTMEPWLLE